MKLLPEHIARQLFGEGDQPNIGKDYGIKDESTWTELPISYDEAKPWFDSYADSLWSKYSAILEPCLEASYPLPSTAPLKTGCWQRWQTVGDSTSANTNVKGTWITIATDDLPPAMILDTEAVKNQAIWLPICAVAMGIDPKTHQPTTYAWVATWEAIAPIDTSLVPFPNNRLVIGWNISYDRQYLASEYQIEDSGNRYLDGMGWAQSLYGISDQQLPDYKLSKHTGSYRPWLRYATEVALDKVFTYLFNIPLDKSTRTNILSMTWYDWTKEIDDILIYCAKDVRATNECCVHMYMRMKRDFVRSPISWIGQLEMSVPLIPLDKGWYDYLARCQKAEYEVSRRHEALLIELANAKADSNDQDPRVGDWTPLKSGANKGKPKWLTAYLKNPTMGSRITPILLGLQWDGKDIQWRAIDSHNGYWETVEADGFEGEKLPHPDGETKNLSTPLICDKGATYETYAKEQRITSSKGIDLVSLYDELNSLTNWTALSKRCENLRAIKTRQGLITLPQVVVMGTQSRRAKDNLWLVAPKPEPRKIGSELRGMVNAPIGWRICGADFDS